MLNAVLVGAFQRLHRTKERENFLNGEQGCLMIDFFCGMVMLSIVAEPIGYSKDKVGTVGGELPIRRNDPSGTGTQEMPPDVRHLLLVILVCFFLISDLCQPQRFDAGHFKITVALQTRDKFAFFEFIFADINFALALRAPNYH
jgi:hypothetical protein